MHALLENTLNRIRQDTLLCQGDVVYVALSGGADSVTLLYVMCQLRETLRLDDVRALHVHHGIRGENADRDEAFVKNLCHRMNVPLTIAHVDTPAEAKAAGESLEEAGRRLRYAFFERATQDVDNAKIAVAHNADDHAETVLFHIMRGCGIKGLCGIPAKRGNIIRPLIDSFAKDIREFCKQFDLPFVTDETNVELSYARNRIRHETIPSMLKINDRVKEHLIALATIAGEEDRYLQGMAQNLLLSALVNKDQILIESLKVADPVILKRCLKEAAKIYGGIDVQRHHIEELAAVLIKGGSVNLPNGVIARSNGRVLTFGKSPESMDRDSVCVPLKLNETVMFGDAKYTCRLLSIDEYEKTIKINKKLFHFCISYDIIYGALYLRTRKAGDTIRLYKRHCSKTLKKWFNEVGIPSEKRHFVPVLCDDNGLLGVVGYEADERAAVTENTKTILIIEKIK